MIETTVSKDFVYLCILHLQYISIEDSKEAIIFKPQSITFNKSTELWELDVELISNKKYDDNEEQQTYGSCGFFKGTPRILKEG